MLGRVTAGLLRQMDRMIRSAVHSALHLPKDTTCGFFYAGVREGGLGIMCLSSSRLPVLQHRRFSRLSECSETDVRVVMLSQRFVCHLLGLPFICSSSGDLIDSLGSERRHHSRLLCLDPWMELGCATVMRYRRQASGWISVAGP